MTVGELIINLQRLPNNLQCEVATDKQPQSIRVVREAVEHSMFNGETEERKFALISSNEQHQIEFKNSQTRFEPTSPNPGRATEMTKK